MPTKDFNYPIHETVKNTTLLKWAIMDLALNRKLAVRKRPEGSRIIADIEQWLMEDENVAQDYLGVSGDHL